MAILPIGTEEIEFYSVELLYNGLIIETKEQININEFQKKVLKVTEGKGYSYYVTNPNKLLENEKQGIDNMSYPLLLSGTVLFFSFLSIVLTSMAALYMERKNISIKSALGASTFQICLPFIIEYMLLFVLAICIGIMYFQWENSGVIEIQKGLENSIVSFFGTLKSLYRIIGCYRCFITCNDPRYICNHLFQCTKNKKYIYERGVMR